MSFGWDYKYKPRYAAYISTGKKGRTTVKEYKAAETSNSIYMY